MYSLAMTKKQAPKHLLVTCINGCADSGLGRGLGEKATLGGGRCCPLHYLWQRTVSRWATYRPVLSGISTLFWNSRPFGAAMPPKANGIRAPDC